MRTLKQMPVKNKRVLVRADFDVPLKDNKVADDRRIKAIIPTIKYLLKNNCSIILCAHLDRPKGFDKSLRMNPIAKQLEKLLKKKIIKTDNCIGLRTKKIASRLKPKEICLLENVRFHPEEQANNPNFAKQLAEHADIYVNDAFATAHRLHASIIGIPKHIPSCIGLFFEKEINMLKKALKPKKPLVVLLGGKKVHDKVGVINGLAKKASKFLIGTAIAFAFFKAQGREIGKSLGKDEAKTAKKLLRKLKNKIILPEDIVVAKNLKSKGKVVSADKIPKNMIGFDMGPKAVKTFAKQLKQAKTIVWNGPLGVFEQKQFAKATKYTAKVIANSKAQTIICGGDTADAVESFAKKFTHVSTGGGAALKFLEGRKLPAIKALEENKRKFKVLK